ncbi:hypothetical protein QO010_002241 [Caulobacter ginsengisoli]|uniref:Uncharacterized protein n=1 Tax=Caulobacter ginsengisoli TaxID=400775 RepID=A0ABU0ISQ9_9CAUL|nr:hypothetical protein [Caulobacter ginsengisoli]MDQ0464460.1 hypothetical protein [Caulobacter ginsengisoli]
MLLWDGDLLNFHFGDSNHSLNSWGVSFGRSMGVDSGFHSPTPDLFSSEGLNGHWTLDNLMPVLSAEHMIDVSSPSSELVSDGLTGTVETSQPIRHEDNSSALILPSVLKVEEPFAIPLPVDTIAGAGLGDDSLINMSEGLMPDMMLAKPQWTIPMRLSWIH